MTPDREAEMDDAPCYYGASEAEAWAAGYNAALTALQQERDTLKRQRNEAVEAQCLMSEELVTVRRDRDAAHAHACEASLEERDLRRERDTLREVAIKALSRIWDDAQCECKVRLSGLPSLCEPCRVYHDAIAALSTGARDTKEPTA
jgi:hypothetical protein